MVRPSTIDDFREKLGRRKTGLDRVAALEDRMSSRFPLECRGEISESDGRYLENRLQTLQSIKGGMRGDDQCISCEDPYLAVFTIVTEGYCPGCAAEIFYGDTSFSAESIIAGNTQLAKKGYMAHKAMSEGQRTGKGKVSS